MTILRTTTTYIRRLMVADSKAMLALRERNRDFLQPWEPLKQPGYLTLGVQRLEIQRTDQEWSADRGYAFGVFDTASDDLVGRLALSNIVRGAWQNATMGYFVGEEYNGRGHCTNAVALALEFAFETARLHRVQAATMLNNAASARVLEKNGFSFEGVARRYLRINGNWEDHNVYSLTVEDWRGPLSV
ncbi:MAG TPA: GNAT family protein [Actinomycetota bacterium]|nr:GNAT family protein [Actinomycetota bacterium]